MDKFGKRLKEAREHARLSQSELARRVPPMRAQAIQYLENPKNKAHGSKYTNSLARVCRVDANWLATGKGEMLPPAAGVNEPGGNYSVVSDDALQIAIAWSKLSPERQEFFRELIFLHAAFESRAPWLRRGRPKSETYEAWERRQEQNFSAMIELAAARHKQ